MKKWFKKRLALRRLRKEACLTTRQGRRAYERNVQKLLATYE